MPVIPNTARSKIVGSYNLHVTADGEEVRHPPARVPCLNIIIEQALGVRTEMLWTRVDTAAWHAMRRLVSNSGWTVTARQGGSELWVRRPARIPE